MTGASRSREGAEPLFVPRHATEDEYLGFLRRHVAGTGGTLQTYLAYRERFVEAYPDLEGWLEAPLIRRVGRIPGRDEYGRPGQRSWTITDEVCYWARPYLFYLVVQGRLRLDLEWLVATRRLRVWGYLAHAGMDVAVERLADEAEGLGYARDPARTALRWGLSRLYLHTGNPDVDGIRYEELEALRSATRSFAERPDVDLYYKSGGYHTNLRYHLTQLHLLGVVLYHRGQIPKLPPTIRRGRPAPVSIRPRMEAVAERYLAARRLTVTPATEKQDELYLRTFIAWVSKAHPHVESFAQVDRDMVLEYAGAMMETIVPNTGKPPAPSTRARRLQVLAVFFRDTAEWGWEEVPGRPLLGPGDYPKLVERVPRFIPDEDLEPLMEAIRGLECPYQRTALLATRWSGARQDEIIRLEADCLDSYPGGMARLRVPAGKTKKERVVPLHDEAAEAIRELQRISHPGRGLPDRVTDRVTRYLFTRYGKLLSRGYLFDAPLEFICAQLGLAPTDGKKPVSAHRFRHTLGTQMAEKEAKLLTIMKVLGHSSPGMSMVYLSISDEAVRKDYEKVLGPGATIAGPIAEKLRSGELSESAMHWLKTNFFKTELELGHCLRLPQEGPCECDLYLSCAKFVTAKEYAPRLRARRELELELIEDACERGWEREEERHQRTVMRIEQLLEELDEPIDQ